MRGNLFKSFFLISYQGLQSGSFSGLKAWVSGICSPWSAWKSTVGLLNTGIRWGAETIAKGVFWLGTRTAAIFPLASCPGTIWNWVVFSKLGVVSKLFDWFDVKRDSSKGEVTGNVTACDCCNGRFSDVVVVGFMIGGQGEQYDARCESKRARTWTSNPSSDIRYRLTSFAHSLYPARKRAMVLGSLVLFIRAAEIKTKWKSKN